MAKTKTAPVVKTEQKVVPAKKTPTKKDVPKTPAPVETKETKIQKTFSEVFESDVDSQVESFLSANGVDTYEIVSEVKEEGSIVKTIEITL